MKNIWIISDTHFGHTNIIKYCNRPFDNAEEMDEVMIERWNSVVKPEDRVYHLGDVYMGSKERMNWIMARLNGKKRLILGNHDNGKDPVLWRNFESIDLWKPRRDIGIVFSHIPLALDSFPGRCTKNVHGHIHNNRPSATKQHVNVSVEMIDYTPVNLDTLL